MRARAPANHQRYGRATGQNRRNSSRIATAGDAATTPSPSTRGKSRALRDRCRLGLRRGAGRRLVRIAAAAAAAGAAGRVRLRCGPQATEPERLASAVVMVRTHHMPPLGVDVICEDAAPSTFVMGEFAGAF